MLFKNDDEMIKILDEDKLKKEQRIKLERQRGDYKTLLEAQQMINKDEFFAKISEERVEELKKKLVELRKTIAHDIDDSLNANTMIQRENQKEL